MNKKAVALIVLIIVLVIAGIAIAVGLSQNSENTNNLAQNESNTGSQVNTEEVGQTANNGTDTNTVSNEIANTNTNTTTNEETSTSTEEKILVVYFSQTGNTETVANFIHEAVGGDIIKLETEQTYTSDYNELLDVAQEERRNNARPALRTQINNIDEYHLHMKVEQFVERRRILNK